MPSNTSSAPRKTTYPAQKNKICFPIIKKGTRKHQVEAVSNAIKTRKKKAIVEQTNKLALPVLPDASFTAGRRWVMSHVRGYVIARQSSEEDVEDYIERLKVAYHLDFPLWRHLDESEEAYADRQIADLERTLLPILEYGVDKFCFLASKGKWSIANVDEVEIPEPRPRPLPRPAWNKRKASAALTAPVATPPPAATASPTLSPTLSPYQFASPAPELSPLPSSPMKYEESVTPRLGSPFSPSSVKCEEPQASALFATPLSTWSSSLTAVGSSPSFSPSPRSSPIPFLRRSESSFGSSTAFSSSPSLSPSPSSSPAPLVRRLPFDEDEDDDLPFDENNFFDYCDRMIDRYYAEKDDTSSEAEEAEVGRTLESYDEDSPRVPFQFL